MITGYLYPLSPSLYPKGYQVTTVIFIAQKEILDGKISSPGVIASRLNGFLYPAMPRLYPAGLRLSKSNFLSENLYLPTKISSIAFTVTYELVTSDLQSDTLIESVNFIYITLFDLDLHISDVDISNTDLFCNPTIFEPEQNNQFSNLEADIKLLPNYLLPTGKSHGLTIAFQQANEQLRESSYNWQKGIAIDKKIDQVPIPVAEKDRPKFLTWNEKYTVDANKHFGIVDFLQKLDCNKMLLVGPLIFYDLIKLIAFNYVLACDRNIKLPVNTPLPYDNTKSSNWDLHFPIDRELELSISIIFSSDRHMLLPWGKEFFMLCQKVYNPPEDLEFLLDDVLLHLEKLRCKMKLYPNASKLYPHEIVSVDVETLRIR